MNTPYNHSTDKVHPRIRNSRSFIHETCSQLSSLALACISHQNSLFEFESRFLNVSSGKVNRKYKCETQTILCCRNIFSSGSHFHLNLVFMPRDIGTRPTTSSVVKKCQFYQLSAAATEHEIGWCSFSSLLVFHSTFTRRCVVFCCSSVHPFSVTELICSWDCFSPLFLLRVRL